MPHHPPTRGCVCGPAVGSSRTRAPPQPAMDFQQLSNYSLFTLFCWAVCNTILCTSVSCPSQAPCQLAHRVRKQLHPLSVSQAGREAETKRRSLVDPEEKQATFIQHVLPYFRSWQPRGQWAKLRFLSAWEAWEAERWWWCCPETRAQKEVTLERPQIWVLVAISSCVEPLPQP